MPGLSRRVRRISNAQVKALSQLRHDPPDLLLPARPGPAGQKAAFQLSCRPLKHAVQAHANQRLHQVKKPELARIS